MTPDQLTSRREWALDKASQLVDEWTAQVKNERGYVHDRWQPTPLRDRTEAVLKVAEFLLKPSGQLTPPLTSPLPVATILGWRLDGHNGPPSKGQYDTARIYLEQIDNGNIPAGESNAEALNALITAYQIANPEATRDG